MKIHAAVLGICVALAPVISVPASTTLLLRYNFDEAGSGSQPTADLGEAEPLVDGRFFGDATRTGNTPGGRSTGALDVTVDGASVIANHDHPDVPSLDGKLDNLGRYTVTLWVNLQADPNHLDRIFKAGNDNGFGYRIVNPSEGELSASNFGFALDIAGGNVAFGNADIDADDRWVFIAVTFDGDAFDEMVKLYVGDETQSAEVLATANSLVTNMGALDAPLRLGLHPNFSHRQVNAFIDDFRVYEGVADAVQIEEIRNENLSNDQPPDELAALLLRYAFDESDSGDDPTADLGEAEPTVDGRFFGGATRTGNTPGGHSTGALDVTVDGASVIANHDHPDVPSLDGKLDNLGRYTVSLWVNLQADPNHLDRIFRAGNDSGFGLRIVDPPEGGISASNFGLALDIVGGNVPFPEVSLDADDKWLFLAVVFEAGAADTVRLYAGNETEPVSVLATANTTVPDTGALDAPLRLGRHPNASHRQVNAFLDDFRVYGEVVDATGIDEIRRENLSADVADGYAGWLEEFFTPEEIADPAVGGPNADPDDDGIPNLLEYALGGDPTVPGRAVLPVEGRAVVDGEEYLTLTVTRPEGIDDVVYTVEVSVDLVTWTENAEPVESVTQEGEIRETFRAAEPLGHQPRQFLRLRVTQQEPD